LARGLAYYVSPLHGASLSGGFALPTQDKGYFPECFLEAPTNWDGQGTDSSGPVCGLSTPSEGGLLPSTIPLKIAQAFMP